MWKWPRSGQTALVPWRLHLPQGGVMVAQTDLASSVATERAAVIVVMVLCDSDDVVM